MSLALSISLPLLWAPAGGSHEAVLQELRLRLQSPQGDYVCDRRAWWNRLNSEDYLRSLAYSKHFFDSGSLVIPLALRGSLNPDRTHDKHERLRVVGERWSHAIQETVPTGQEVRSYRFFGGGEIVEYSFVDDDRSVTFRSGSLGWFQSVGGVLYDFTSLAATTEAFLRAAEETDLFAPSEDTIDLVIPTSDVKGFYDMEGMESPPTMPKGYRQFSGSVRLRYAKDAGASELELTWFDAAGGIYHVDSMVWERDLGLPSLHRRRYAPGTDHVLFESRVAVRAATPEESKAPLGWTPVEGEVVEDHRFGGLIDYVVDGGGLPADGRLMALADGVLADFERTSTVVRIGSDFHEDARGTKSENPEGPQSGPSPLLPILFGLCCTALVLVWGPRPRGGASA